MKKIIALLLVLAMALSLIACNSAPADDTVSNEQTQAADNDMAADDVADSAEKPYEGVELKLWMAPFSSDSSDQSFWEGQLAAFEEETGANVEVEIVGWGDMATKYLTGFMADDAADVIYMTNEILYDFINQGNLADLSGYWSEEEIANENFWDATAYAGKHYMIPFAGGSGYRGYVYNMDILNECGITEVPTTWDELLSACEIIHEKRPDVYTFLTPLSGNNNNTFLTNMLLFMYQAGGSMVNEDATAYTLNTPEALEAMNFLKTLFDKGYLSEDSLGLGDDNIRDLVREGKVAISVIDAPHVYLAEAEFEWLFTTEMANVQSASFCPVDTLTVNAGTENMEAAVAMLKYLRSDEVITEFYTNLYQGGQVVKTWPDVITDEHMQDVLAHSERAFTLPIAPNLQLVIDSIMKNQQLMVMGTLTPEEALAQIQAEADKAFE